MLYVYMYMCNDIYAYIDILNILYCCHNSIYAWCSQPLARRLYCNGLFPVSSFLSLDLENDTFAGLSIVPAECIIVETMERGGGIGRRPLQ